MVWVIVGAAIIVTGVAALAATGRLGEMPPPVDGWFAGRVPDEVTFENLAEVQFGRANRGYDRELVDQAIADCMQPEVDLNQKLFDGSPSKLFRLKLGGYRVEQVDAVFAQLGAVRNNDAAVGQEEMREPNGSDEATNR